MTGPRISASASRQPSTRKIGSRLVKKLPGPITTASSERMTSRDLRVDGHGRLEPQAPDRSAAGLAGVHADFAAGVRSVVMLGAQCRALDGDRPHVAAAAEQRAQAVDGGEEVAAGVLLHHREQQIAAGVPRQLAVARASAGARAGSCAPRARCGERQRALEHVARRQHAELVAQLPRRSAAVEHRDDGVQIDPGIALEPAEQTRQPGAAAEAADLEDTQASRRHCMTWLRSGASRHRYRRTRCSRAYNAEMADAFVIPVTARRAFDRLASDAARVFESRFVAVIATSRFRLRGLRRVDHQRRSRRARRARRDVASRRSRDAAAPDGGRVPAIARHVSRRIPGDHRSSCRDRGRPPFDGCDRAARRASPRLRSAGQGTPDSPAAGLDRSRRPCRRRSRHCFVRSAAPLRALLTNVARLHGIAETADGDRAIARGQARQVFPTTSCATFSRSRTRRTAPTA